MLIFIRQVGHYLTNYSSSFTFPGEPYRIFLLILPWLPSHFYLFVISTTTKGSPKFPPLCYLCIKEIIFLHTGEKRVESRLEVHDPA